MFNFEDYTKNFEKMMSQSPIKVDEAMKSVMDYNAKFGKIALDTVKKNTELSQAWAKENLTALDPFVKSTEKPEEFMKIATDYVSSQTQSTPKHLAEFAEVAKKAQLETIDLMMKAGKDAQEELSSVTKKAATSKE
tara:strand:+ start:115 stop:522 length:408 start_codon:yes stop_codon:yes gene_type:complete